MPGLRSGISLVLGLLSLAPLAEAARCAADSTASVRITRARPRLNRRTGRYLQFVDVTNTSSKPIPRPLSLALDDLSVGTTLYNRDGETACGERARSPFVNISIAGRSLTPGARAVVLLEFTTAPVSAVIRYAPRVLSGPGAR